MWGFIVIIAHMHRVCLSCISIPLSPFPLLKPCLEGHCAVFIVHMQRASILFTLCILSWASSDGPQLQSCPIITTVVSGLGPINNREHGLLSWLVSLSMMLSSSIHFPANYIISFVFVACLSNIPARARARVCVCVCVICSLSIRQLLGRIPVWLLWREL
jgi:hypothetical protein